MENDLFGMALENYFLHQMDEAIIIHSPDFDEDEILPSWYFRSYEEMPEIEKFALEKCKGSILDVGAGAGSHALCLQNRGHNVSALDISEGACKVMKARGVKNVFHKNIFDLKSGKYDTILMLMNGIGLCETLEGLDLFLAALDGLLKAGGELIFDSSNLIYLYYEEEREELLVNSSKYYGEIDFQMEYLGKRSKPFSWLYIDFEELSKRAAKFNFKSEILLEGSNLHYLARVFR
ncbi:MAG: methyltransferase domain-containing protein [Bacteroidales bacterium]|nr:methyltransferase domain-containing protein [Bacteroidales bacterium]MCF8389472.1 methyltransferase domain-containing protein [Bacteroidales bacterium]